MEPNSILLGICALLILWELSAVSFTNKKIKVPGTVPGQRVGIGLFAVAFVLIVWRRWGTDTLQLLLMAAIVIAAGLNFLMKHGLSDYGVYLNGWSTPYKDMKYYDIERTEGELTRLRIASTRRDVTLLFKEQDLQLAIAYLDKNKIYDMETYRALLERQRGQ